MAEADPDSSDTSELVDLKHMFSIPGFFVGFGSKDTDAGKSPTSPLDFGVFANFGGLFSPRSPPPSSPHRNKWLSHKVGLSVLSSTFGQGDEGLSDSFLRDNIVLAPQIKLNVNTLPKLSTDLYDPCDKSNSLPKNYAVAVNIHPPHPCVVGDANAVEKRNSPRRSSSSPMDIISSQAYSRPLSAREMALSEDYTCIISHGPNPKTTHIFGDCILNCDPNELGGLGSEEGDSLPNLPDDSFSQLCLCRGTPQERQKIHTQREKETEDCLDISRGSSYNEDLFRMGMPLNP